MSLVLWELAGADQSRRFSPFCWRVRLALRHKGLDFETKPWRFVEKDAIAFSGQGKVPVLQDGDKTICDSWAIAEYLDQAYPDRPSVLGQGALLGLNRFATTWSEQVLLPLMFQMLVADIHAHVDDVDKDYFRATREKRLGRTLEEAAASRDPLRPQLDKALIPLRTTLQGQPFMGGDAPTWADMAVFGGFQWARSISSYALLDRGDPIWAWRERMSDAYDGEGRSTTVYAQA